MAEDKSFGLDPYVILIFWSGIFLCVMSIITTLVSPYTEFIKPFSIEIVWIYLLILLLVIPFSSKIIKIKYKEYEIVLKDEKKRKEIERFTKELEPIIDSKEETKDKRLKFIVDNKQYFEGFGYYYKKLEETIKSLLRKKEIRYDENISLGKLFKLASENGLIDSMSQKRLALFIESRNRFVHSNEKMDLPEEQIKNILILASHTLNDLERLNDE